MDLQDIRSRLAAKLKEFRLSSGLTAREVGEQIGRSEKTVSGWEHGRGQPDADMLFVLCKLYNIENFDVFFQQPKVQNDDYSSDEVELLTVYQSLNSSGKNLLLQTARSFAGNPGMTEEESGSSAM